MKYGLLVFEKTRNIGDDIQSYVAMKYLPRIDYYVDRENLDSFMPNSMEKVAVIMNGWFIHYSLNWPPSPYIKPLPVSMHFTGGKMFWDIKGEGNHLLGYGVEYLKKISPVGCRDTHTLELLSSKGINSEFTGCLTLTLEKFEGITKQDYICAVDVSSEVLKKIKETTNLEIKEITHDIPEDYYKLSWQERMKNVEDLLKIYQGAKCVVTTRLHCSLPCTALGTPVLLIHDICNDDRIKDFLEFLDFCYEPDFLKDKYSYDFMNPPVNKTIHHQIRDNLNAKCKSFIENCENNSDEKLLLDRDLYSNYVIDKSNLLKEIIFKLEDKIDNINTENSVKTIEKDNVINDLENKISELSIKLYDTSNKLDHIETSKAWKICKKAYSVRDKVLNRK